MTRCKNATQRNPRMGYESIIELYCNEHQHEGDAMQWGRGLVSYWMYVSMYPQQSVQPWETRNMRVYTVEPHLGMPIASWLMQLICHAWISTQERRAKNIFFLTSYHAYHFLTLLLPWNSTGICLNTQSFFQHKLFWKSAYFYETHPQPAHHRPLITHIQPFEYKFISN